MINIIQVPKKNNISKKIYISFLSLILIIIIFEAIISLTDLDIKHLEPSLYRSGSRTEFYKVSEDSNLLVELKPNFTVLSLANNTYTINNLGFRDKERKQTKEEGVFRIIILGGSNTYGAEVGDNGTYPQYLEEELNKRFQKKIEVWNAGISAYVMSQKFTLANKMIKDYDPDLIIFQTYNQGRRAFLFDEDVDELFKANKQLFLENIPLLIIKFPSRTTLKIHNFLCLYSRTYRLIHININNILITKEKTRKSIDEKYGDSINHYGQQISKIKFEEYLSKNKDIKTLIFIPLEIKSPAINYTQYPQIKYLKFDSNEKGTEYSEIHPPNYVYQEYAQQIADFLEKEQYINN